MKTAKGLLLLGLTGVFFAVTGCDQTQNSFVNTIQESRQIFHQVRTEPVTSKSIINQLWNLEQLDRKALSTKQKRRLEATRNQLLYSLDVSRLRSLESRMMNSSFDSHWVPRTQRSSAYFEAISLQKLIAAQNYPQPELSLSGKKLQERYRVLLKVEPLFTDPSSTAVKKTTSKSDIDDAFEAVGTLPDSRFKSWCISRVQWAYRQLTTTKTSS
ncbi:toxin Cry1Ac domain D-VI-related protein [Lacticaseibacillus parakribbianus]|uniref:toxin Cry1Ac domain D-VI-related protein n=1 Tax=Lacticaseibacillus parakribbianus TaxID=2970927 RepID=UPI0021CB2876|nr:toxin Cry1Ac domain D-VI-related protein [Lacticaseibacillus parakribbianus]